MSDKKNKPWKFSLGSISDFNAMCAEIGCEIDAVEDTSSLAEPVMVNDLVIPNSLVVHPMEGCDGDRQGNPGKLTLRRYQRFAAGGAGLIWAEATAVVHEGRANPRQLWLNDNNKGAFADMVSMMRHHAAQSIATDHQPIIALQLTHSGRYSKPDGTSKPLIPQRDPYRDPLLPEPEPTATRTSKVDDSSVVTDEYLDNLQDAYVKAANLAYQAGFDAIDIKSCHGYLINELLSSRNRPGKYGGNFENRTRFLLEVIDKIKSELGDKIEICTRLGFYDALPYPFGWGVDEQDYTRCNLDEPKKLVKLLSQRGVRLINFTIGNPYYNPHVNRPFNQPAKNAYTEPEHPLKGVERLINLCGQMQKEFPEIAFVGTGYSWLKHLMPNIAAAAKIKGKAKLFGAGRLAFAYPDFARDILNTGTLDAKKVCIACSGCTQLMRDNHMTGCVIRDRKFYDAITGGKVT
ncbi:MAG: hypothetical protein JXD22_15590 [Sedimentisphaerales bacterium]|nr:hypothetical protein [Sedimentisphaerales bacterium]